MSTRNIRWINWLLVILVIIIALPLLYFFEPWVYLPHKKIQMSLPFTPEVDATTGLIPLGEKIEHNESNGNPNGHAGLDFGFKQETDILAVTDGLITNISKDKEGITIEQRTWFYRMEYKELNSVAPGIHLFSLVKKGQPIGNVGTSEDISKKFEKGAKSRQMHWDFASSSMTIDRLCPVNYFDEESKKRIEKIWANVPAGDIFRKDYPKICNGYFDGRED